MNKKGFLCLLGGHENHLKTEHYRNDSTESAVQWSGSDTFVSYIQFPAYTSCEVTLVSFAKVGSVFPQLTELWLITAPTHWEQLQE